MKETDLYKPVKELFEKMGYTVNGEVKDMDVTAVRGDELVVVELKTAFNITLLQQAVKRQKITEQPKHKGETTRSVPVIFTISELSFLRVLRYTRSFPSTERIPLSSLR